jgi:REP element-mobilizing transposase RayT
MARPVRIDFPGAKHHVMNRGLRRGPVFIDDWCCEEFVDLLPEAVERYDIVVYGYALMPNHYHLLLGSTHGNLSSAMAFVSSNFSREMNKRFDWEGSVFRGRYHNRVVYEPAHWHHLLAYIHLNPVKANLVMRMDQSRWTSHGAYSGKLRCPEWLNTEEILSELGGAKGYRQYIKEMRMGRRTAPSEFEQVLFGRRRSSEAFIVKQEEGARDISAEEAIQQVLELTHAKKTELKKTRRGRAGNPARAVAAWWLTHGAGLTNVRAGKYLDMTPVAVSRALAHVQSQLVRNRKGEISRWVHSLREMRG